ncbi:SPFH domain-containing protein [Candidatus Dojkabacteria bacterium]|uniref:SPFH domain-containing protein n=1 Tax=Candidatus Dojkabacteria bacterium TaxID=2099670 RepID=A0A955LBB0_9BACT|nr:SPFH domain-containing protein [Candidatus Dojkabacteria bacterium]
MDGFAYFLVFLCILGLITFFSTFFIVEQQKVAVIETFGRFSRVARPGLNFKIPFVERIAGRLSLRVQQLDVKAETKTQDNVFVHITVSVQYFVNPENVYDAFYKLDDPALQINSYVFDVIRARVPRINIDRLFEEKEEIANAIKEELNETMTQFGFQILNSLVTDIDPDAKVKVAMNEINAAERMKVAAREKAEANKIMKVKEAEADAESKALQGKGIADQRLAIVQGLRESVEDFQEGVQGTTAHDVMNLVLMTQYFDTLKDVGQYSNTILIPHSPGGMQDIETQLRNAMIQAHEVERSASRNEPGKKIA